MEYFAPLAEVKTLPAIEAFLTQPGDKRYLTIYAPSLKIGDVVSLYFCAIADA